MTTGCGRGGRGLSDHAATPARADATTATTTVIIAHCVSLKTPLCVVVVPVNEIEVVVLVEDAPVIVVVVLVLVERVLVLVLTDVYVVELEVVSDVNVLVKVVYDGYE